MNGLVNKNLRGLNAREVLRRQSMGQVNEIDTKIKKSFIRIFLEQILFIPHLLIVFSSLLLAYFGELADSLLISIFTLSNVLISATQEYSVRSSLEKMKIISVEPVKVIRNKNFTKILPEEIVLDELIVLSSGENIYVDGVIVEAEFLLVDESIITGESDYVQKNKGDQILSGSYVVSGSGYYRAEKVGKQSYVNKLNKQLKKYKYNQSFLQKSIATIAKTLTYMAIFIVFLLFMLSETQEFNKVDITNAIIATMHALIPQGVLMSMTMAFLVGVYRMYSQRIIVQKASAIEKLSQIDIVCFDKTGTLTKNEMLVEESFLPDNNKFLDSKDIGGLIFFLVKETIEKNKTTDSILRYLINCIDHVTDYKALQQLPFNSKDKLSCMRIEIQHNTVYEVILGAPEILEKKLSKKETEKLRRKNTEFAQKGLRNIAVLISKVESPNLQLTMQENYYFAALIGINNQLREGVAEVFNLFRSKNVKPIIISGDSESTVRSLVQQLNLGIFRNFVSGEMLSRVKDKFWKDKLILNADVFTRVTPDQKLDIVKTLQQHNYQVAMIGDGINDAMALKYADLGISLGAGANISKNVADIILLDNSLSLLNVIIQEGRDIMYNVLRNAQILLVKNITALIVILGTLLFTVPFPFTPRILFLVAFVNSTYPGLIILSEKGTKISNFSFKTSLLIYSIIGGLISGSIILAFLSLSRYETSPKTEVNSIVIIFLSLIGIANFLVINQREYKVKILNLNKKDISVITLSILILITTFFIKELNTFFNIQKTDFRTTLLIIYCSVAYYVLFSLIYNIYLHYFEKSENR